MGKGGTTLRAATAGVRRARAERVWLLAAWGAIGVAGVALLVTAVRPLPDVTVADAGPDFVVPGAVRGGASIGAREERLRALAMPGNIFAFDRLAWMDEAAEEAVAQAEEPEPMDVEVQASTSAEVFPEEIVLTERPTSAATKSHDALTLRGLFASGDRKMAMIQGGESDRRKDVELYREGDVFFAKTWRILRIDAKRDRVILEHLGQGDVLELTLYDAAAPGLAAVVPEPAVGVAQVNGDQARADLLEAGVSADEVESVFEVLAALERGEDLPAVEEEAGGVAVASVPERAKKPGEAPAMPSALAELLRSMAADAQSSHNASKPKDPEN